MYDLQEKTKTPSLKNLKLVKVDGIVTYKPDFLCIERAALNLVENCHQNRTKTKLIETFRYHTVNINFGFELPK
jgi:hypothetical protein